MPLSMSRRWQPSGVQGTNPEASPERELRHIRRMKAIHVLGRIERPHDGGFVDVRRRRRLHEDAVNRGIAIQLRDARKQFLLRRRRRQFQLHRMQAELAAHLVFRPHISARGGIIADENDRQPWRDAALFQRRNFAPQFSV